jgi:uncharacterized membrane protein/plastocyanin
MDQDSFDWLLLLLRWLHITVAVTWIGTSIFFMWLDRSFKVNPESKNEGHVGEVWMVHGGGFYHVEKLKMGPTKVPKELHWFKWEAYWTWMSGFALVVLIFYTGDGTFLLDETVSSVTYTQGILIGLFSMFGSWFYYDFLWERKIARDSPLLGHFLTLAWFFGMSYFLCHTLSGRAAYIHIGGMIGTWMTANVFMRIIPRQLKMVEASREGKPVNQEWGVNAKNRSTHNTYFTLPVIFIMLSNHFPATYGHELNWLVLLLISAAGAAIRQFFVIRLSRPARARNFAVFGVLLLVFIINWTRESSVALPIAEVVEKTDVADVAVAKIAVAKVAVAKNTLKKVEVMAKYLTLRGTVTYDGVTPIGKKLRLPRMCAKQHVGDVYTNEVVVNKGRLKHALIRITKGLEGKVIPAASTIPVELDQKGCVYSPRVIGVQVGQPVTFINSDSVFHNVKSVTKKNKRFNIAMPKKNQRKTRVFTQPEIFLQTKCSVHPWMGAYIAVVDHPFFSITNAKGEFELKNLPEGEYEVEVWHEVFGTKKKTITVNADMKINFKYKR